MSDKIMAGDVDITESVQILYDIAHSSMDWGSGFLDTEEMETVIRLAVLMGWQVPAIEDRAGVFLHLARKFPDHYEIKEIRLPESVTSYGFGAHASYRITRKGQ